MPSISKEPTHGMSSKMICTMPSVISAMFVQSILWWLEHGRPCPPEEIAEQSSQLIRAVIEAAASTLGN